jgi:peptidoglycan/LPS O-acetylase OafA/YrhL
MTSSTALAYHALYSGKLTSLAFAGIQLTMGALMVLVWLCSELNWQWISGYLFAMVVFAGGYLLRGHVRSARGLNHLANISYPLYVVHALLGYAVMCWMISNGAGVYAAILATGFVAYVLSVFLHFGIEKPFMQRACA